MSKQPTVAGYIVRRLAREGITDCFGVAGDFAFTLCDAVARSEAIRRSRMPYADLSAFDQDRRLTAVPDLFTVGLVVRYVEWKLGQRVEAGPNWAGAIPVTSSTSSVHRE